MHYLNSSNLNQNADLFSEVQKRLYFSLSLANSQFTETVHGADTCPIHTILSSHFFFLFVAPLKLFSELVAPFEIGRPLTHLVGL